MSQLNSPFGSEVVLKPLFASWDLLTAARQVLAGLPTDTLEHLQESLALSNRELADAILLAPRTLARRRREERLLPDESERVYRMTMLFELALRTLGGSDAARTWMKESNYALGDEVPLQLARTEPGAELVERTLHNIAYGIPV